MRVRARRRSDGTRRIVVEVRREETDHLVDKSEDSGRSHKCTSDVLHPSGARKVLPVVFAGKDSVRGHRNVREKRSFQRKVTSCNFVCNGFRYIVKRGL